MKILITGSSGQIGTNLALSLKDKHEILGVDKRENTWTKDFDYKIMDLRKPLDLDFKPDIVVHLAANAKVHELVKHPERALDNITVTFNVLEFCRKNNTPIVFSSSREVYGDISRFKDSFTDEEKADFKFTESPYSASKISGEALIYSYARCYKLPYIVLRFSNVYGRFDNDIDRMERVIPLFIKKISNQEPITVFGREKILDFTYIDDCISGVISAIEKLQAGKVKNETINLAYGKGQSLLDLVKFIESFLNKKANMTIKETQVGEVRYYIADISKAQRILDYNPKTQLQEGIQKSIDWQRSVDSI